MSTVLITGASRGIGRATAKLLSERKDVSLMILTATTSPESKKTLSTLADEIESKTRIKVHTFHGDVSDIESIRSLKHELQTDHPGEYPDIIINNAAISEVGLLIDMTPETWDRILGTNVTSIYNTCHTFLPEMIQKRNGHIINISSVWGSVGASCEVAYSAAKGAVEAMTRSLAKELAPSHIRVNAVAPGIIDTDMNSHLTSDELTEICDDIPMGRMGTPEEIAGVINQLLDMPEYLTGQIIRCDGGWI